MKTGSLPSNENARLEALKSCGILDTQPESFYDSIAQLAAQLSGCPAAYVCFVDERRSWIKAKFGFNFQTTARDTSVAAGVILQKEILETIVAEDENFNSITAVPLLNYQGLCLGALCVTSKEAKQLSDDQKAALKTLAHQCMAYLELSVKFTAKEELHHAKQKALATSKVNFDFIANLSHEVRTSMNAIIGMADIIAESSDDAESIHNLKIVERVANKLIGMMNDILDLTQNEVGFVPVEEIDFTISGLMHDIILACAPAAHLKGVEFNVSLSNHMLESYCGDGERLGQVLISVMNNAISLCESGEVNLFVGQTQSNPSKLGFVVSDTNSGGSHADEVFQNFSEAKYFPVPAAKRKKRILIAEDNPVNQLLLKRQLEELGYEVSATSDGVALVSMFEQAPFDAVILDYLMPQMDGIKAAQAIRAIEARSAKFRHVPIIAYTGTRHAADEEKCRAAGMDAYLIKPVSSEVLSHSLKTVGMQKNEFNSIFSTFAQTDDYTSLRKLDQVGLSLAMSHKIVEKMKGKFGVVNNQDGNRFYISVPVKNSNHESSTLKVATNFGDKKILLIDNNQTCLNNMTHLMKEWGVAPHCSRDATSAIDCISQLKKSNEGFDFIFVDAHLDSDDGFLMASQIQKLHSPKSTIVMMLSTHDISSEIENTKAIGVQNYLVKPLLPQELKLILGNPHSAEDQVYQPDFSIGSMGKLVSLEGETSNEELEKILVAEDNEHNRIVIKAFLKNEPYTLTFVDNGITAVELFKAEKFHLILLDLQMPHMDGYEALRMMRAWERQQKLPAIPIIAFTASASKEDKKACLKAGFSDFVAKPVKGKALIALINNFLSKKNPWRKIA